LTVQAIGVGATAVWSAVASFAIILVTQAFCGLRASDDDCETGLDLTSHGERGYHT
jgi:Amt family ammonium transporter